MKVAIISVHGCPLLPPGGRETGGMNLYVRELSQEMGRRGIEVDIFTRRHEPDAPSVTELGDKVRVIHLDAGGREERAKEELPQYLGEFTLRVERFRKAQGLKYDIIHSHYWLSGWVGTVLARRWKVPHVAMFHTLGEVKNRARVGEREPTLRIKGERRIIAEVEQIVAASLAEKEQIVRLYDAHPQQVEVIPCGVDFQTFQPLDKYEARKTLGVEEEKLLLFVGRIDPIKGMDILLETVPRLGENGKLRVLVVGGDRGSWEEMERLRALAGELGIEERVSFLGPVEHYRLPYYYSAADVCVIPSYYESFGMVALEAMACGTPVVASRVGGLMSTVKDGETGFLIPWHCPEPFAERLELLLGNQALRDNFGRAARAAAASYQWTSVADKIIELYNDLISRPSRHLRKAADGSS